MRYGLHGRDERVGDCHGRVAGLYSRGHWGERQGVGPVCDPDAMARPAESGVVILKGGKLRAAYEARGPERLPEYRDELRLELHVRRDQVKKWRLVRRVCVTHLSTLLSTLAGFPATIVSGGTSFVTVLPAPTIEFSPMVTLLKMGAPDPMAAPFLTIVLSTFQSASVCLVPSTFADLGSVSFL